MRRQQQRWIGRAADDIFAYLDADGSGTLSYKELTDKLIANVPKDPKTKLMLTSMTTSVDSTLKEERAALNTSSWRIHGRDAQSVQSELQQLLRQSGANVIDLLKLFDQDQTNEHQIDDMEFFRAMQNVWISRLAVIDEARSLDSDHSGSISFDELLNLSRAGGTR